MQVRTETNSNEAAAGVRRCKNELHRVRRRRKIEHTPAASLERPVEEERVEGRKQSEAYARRRRRWRTSEAHSTTTDGMIGDGGVLARI